MNLGIIGLGYLGLTHAVAMTLLGHRVFGYDNNVQKLSKLQSGKITFFEPGLQKAFSNSQAEGTLSLHYSLEEIATNCDLIFLCVGTPNGPNGSHDLSQLQTACSQLAVTLNPKIVVAGKSTVPVGTAAALRDRMSEVAGFPVHLAWNPEFLREGTALEDSLSIRIASLLAAGMTTALRNSRRSTNPSSIEAPLWSR